MKKRKFALENPSLVLRIETLVKEIRDGFEDDYVTFSDSPEFDAILDKIADLRERLGLRKPRFECRCGFLLQAERFEDAWVVTQCPECERRNR